MKINKFEILIAFLISFVAAQISMYAVDVAYMISNHPLISLMIRLLFFILVAPLIMLKKKENIVYVFLFCFPFMRISFSGVGLITVFSACLFILYFKEIIGFIKLKKDNFRTPLFLLGLSIIYTTVFSKYPWEALNKAIFLVSLYLVYLVLSIFLQKEINFRRFYLIQVAILIFGIFIAILQLVFGINSIKLFFGEYNPNVGVYSYIKRIPSFFDEAQGAGLFFALMMIVCIGYLKTYFRKGYFSSLISYSLAIISLTILIYNRTRMSVIGLVIGLLFFQLFSFSLKRIFVIFFVLLMIVILTVSFYPYFPKQVTERFQPYYIKDSANFRLKVWGGSLPIIKNNLFGIGMGGSNLYDAAVRDHAFIKQIYHDYPEIRAGTEVENTYLQILYGLGIVGFIGFVLLVLKYFSSNLSLIRIKRDYPEINLTKYLFVAMIIWLISMFTCPRFYDVQLMLIFGYLLASINALSIRYSIKRTKPGAI